MSSAVDRADNPEGGSVVARHAGSVAETERVVLFRGRPMLLVHDPFDHFVPLTKERFDRLGYRLLGGLTRGQMSDTFAYLGNVAEDLTANDHLIGFGTDIDPLTVEAETDLARLVKYRPVVWDARTLTWERSRSLDDCVWRSPFAPVKRSERIPFIMSLAGGSEAVYDDIMQSLAPLVMERKPDGVIWWVGDGANGKSTLMDAIYRVFPGQLASINLKRLVDGRDSPSLNGTLGNIVKESSEGRIDDTEVYKNLGTHESFRVHRFHSQDDIGVSGNVHTIFSGNSIPIFNDKGFSARRRTFIVPFTQRFESDPAFEERTFTPEFFSQLVSELCRYAVRLRDQGYHYKWSADTLTAKLEYDSEANSAEEYVRDLVQEGVVAFSTFHPVRMDYENWCADEGHVPLGITNLRKALSAVFERVSTRDDHGHVSKLYRLRGVDGKASLQQLSPKRPGLYTLDGFNVPSPATPEPPRQRSILERKW